ncbi:uncharacterized protein LOC116413097 isoform X2 [Galleria mellonella]|uniref:Uncharacterized protein LOC116413097 isoform X2 n=1 Tax=Galleria mellonella TaxID=7137 RepID=A0ABM3N3R5_GALME|nr:uncharacterized protein LOC116413097 isoform X2 [Galleria mellonella]
MRLLWLFALFIFVPTKGLSPVDKLRNKIFTIERQQWIHLNDQQWRTSGSADIDLAKVFVLFDGEIHRWPLAAPPVLSSSWWKKPQKQVRHIQEMYATFLEFMRRQTEPGVKPARVREWLSLAASVLSDPKTAVSRAMSQLHQSVLRDQMFQNVLQEQRKYYNRSELCELQVSPHQLIYDLYNTIALAEIKGYVMMQFSWMLLKIYRPGNITEEVNQTRVQYEGDAIQIAEKTGNALANATRELYRCDPLQHIEGQTYDQITRLMQGYIENEVNMNNENTCRQNCEYYNVAKYYNCFKDQFCSRQPKCKGHILGCYFVKSDMTVCTSVNSWWRGWFLHCSYCMCLCDDPENSDRYFSLKEATSNIRENKVVTGIRLVKQNNVFHIQISEGTLLKNGIVSPGSWLPNKIIKINDQNMKNGIDYHTLNHGTRAIDLDDLVAPAGWVLTGVRFRILGAHLNLNIRATKLNFETGHLSEDSMWIDNDNTDGSKTPRSRLTLNRPNLPTRSLAALPVDSKHDQFLEFTHSDFDKDAAQSTVPFIDVQPLEPYGRGVLLSGAGVSHRGAVGSGGFVALKLFTYDYAPHVRVRHPRDPSSPQP